MLIRFGHVSIDTVLCSRRCSTCGPWSILLRVLLHCVYCSCYRRRRVWRCYHRRQSPSHLPSPAHPAPKTRRRPLIRPLPNTSTPRRLPRTPTHREPALPIPRRRQRLGTTRGPGRSPAVACIEPAYLFRRWRSCTGPSYLHSPGCGPLPRSRCCATVHH